MIKEHPILFSTPMVKAILEGRKTQTRRVVKAKQGGDCPDEMWIDQYALKDVVQWELQNNRWFGCMGYRTLAYANCPYGQVGDLLWVRETWRKYDCDECPCYEYCNCPPHGTFLYYADCLDDEAKWKPSIHMPRQACRLVLEITNIRVERLNDISEADAKAEGFDYSTHPSAIEMGYAIGARTNFRFAWEKIYGQNEWNKNPWVWCITFKVIEGGAA